MSLRELPARPNLDQYRKQAKALLKSSRSGDADARDRVSRVHPRLSSPERIESATVTLADAQLVIAREHGIDSWKKFAERIDTILGDRSPKAVWSRVEHAVLNGDAAALESLIRDYGPMLKQTPNLSWVGDLRRDGLGKRRREDGLDDARAIIAAKQHFESWDRFVAFREALRDNDSLVAQFEIAVDAIVSGDVNTLDRVLREHPQVNTARSWRTHHSTLLLYVGSNGVEGYRQRTPRNAVRIAEMLLDAGAEVDAVGDMYRGTTTLGLVATSIHPVRTGVQEALIDLLIARGASLDRAVAPDYTRGRVVNACLANGRGEGAVLVAERGAMLDLEGAGGVGRLDVVKAFFDQEGHLTSDATPDDMKSAFKWACSYGHIDVVRFLIDRGIDVGERHRGETPLHVAAGGGHLEIVSVLLARGARVDVRDEMWDGTPLGWALFGWANDTDAARRSRYYDVVDRLIAAGAAVPAQWLDEAQISGDARLLAALGRGRSE